jgi:ADP-ribosyl-[dinitrogen reductase] hydrolase
MTMTSITHPLRIDTVATPGGGMIGMTLCPGKQQRDSISGHWSRDLGLDLDRVQDWGATTVVTLMEAHELARFKVDGIGDAVRQRGMTWRHLPIVDGSVPDAPFELAWIAAGSELRSSLTAGRKILLHCRAGLGRTGTIAARLLVELGVPAEAAIARVREARPGTIETSEQEAYVRRHADPAADVIDRARGALLGLAVGDALGTTIEFQPRDSYPKQTEMTGGGPFDLEAGQWTDDTSMALALADSLIARPDFDPVDLMDRFVRWWKQGEYSCTGSCFDIGITTQAALARYRRTGDPFAGATDEDTAGNGSLMRLSPVALAALHDPDKVRRIAAEQSRTTHGAPQAVQACIWFANLLRRAILGEPKASLLAPGAWDGHAAIRAIAAGTWRGRPRARIRSSGYVVDTLEAALWSVDQTDSFEDAVVLAVNLGDDADTVGAVTGQLAGALYGSSAIPERWLADLAWRPRIQTMADALLTASSPDAAG